MNLICRSNNQSHKAVLILHLLAELLSHRDHKLGRGPDLLSQIITLEKTHDDLVSQLPEAETVLELEKCGERTPDLLLDNTTAIDKLETDLKALGDTETNGENHREKEEREIAGIGTLREIRETESGTTSLENSQRTGPEIAGNCQKFPNQRDAPETEIAAKIRKEKFLLTGKRTARDQHIGTRHESPPANSMNVLATATTTAKIILHPEEKNVQNLKPDDKNLQLARKVWLYQRTARSPSKKSCGVKSDPRTRRMMKVRKTTMTRPASRKADQSLNLPRRQDRGNPASLQKMRSRSQRKTRMPLILIYLIPWVLALCHCLAMRVNQMMLLHGDKGIKRRETITRSSKSGEHARIRNGRKREQNDERKLIDVVQRKKVSVGSGNWKLPASVNEFVKQT